MHDRTTRLGPLLLALAASLVPAARSAAAAERPNVVFILTDDQRWNCLGLADDPAMATPNLDRLGREGVYFRNAFCTTSLCSPSRASILGGLYAHSHGVTNNFTEYPVDLPTFPRQLQAAGYETAYIGKYHMGEENDDKRPASTPSSPTRARASTSTPPSASTAASAGWSLAITHLRQ